MKRITCLLLALLASPAAAIAAERIADYDVVRDTPGTDSRDSMPLGNGDIGLNVWTEENGDIVFYVSKTDAWTDNVGGNKGLAKLGRVRVRFAPAGKFARQSLRLQDGAVEVKVGAISTRVWVDANRPVIRVEADAPAKFTMQVGFESLRPAAEKDLAADTILDGQKDRVVWFYRNGNRRIPQLTGLTFGAMLRGDGLVGVDRTTLRTAQPVTRTSVSIYPLTARTETPQQWLAQAEQSAHAARDGDWAAHCQWWRKFWDRSWIFASGNDDARKVAEGYVLQRFVTACAGRGAYPIKFNGSIFTMDWLKRERVNGVEKQTLMSPDARDWGGQYWFQNTRAMYWPMLQSGDFEMMRPLIRMYQNQLPGNAKAVREFYGHDGAYFAETNPFWGSLPNIKPGEAGSYTKHYYTPILELSAMMLDYFAYTGDREFVKQSLLPVADAGLTFFDQHFRHENGKLVLDPDNAIEMYWIARNPAPDIAGLRWVLGGLLALPPDLTSTDDRGRWQKLLAAVPELPSGEKGGSQVLLPAEVYNKGHNFENPELYAVYPFRLFGLGKPGLDMARATFAARRFKTNGCWRQDGIQAALLGDTETAKKNVAFVFTRKDKQCSFPAFWDHGSDYVPDEDNGGNGLNALQLMLLQSEGRHILLLPAWPKDWDCDFKLHAPLRTTVEGRVRGGKIESLRVEPSDRVRDVEVLQPDGSLRRFTLQCDSRPLPQDLYRSGLLPASFDQQPQDHGGRDTLPRHADLGARRLPPRSVLQGPGRRWRPIRKRRSDRREVRPPDPCRDGCQRPRRICVATLRSGERAATADAGGVGPGSGNSPARPIYPPLFATLTSWVTFPADTGRRWPPSNRSFCTSAASWWLSVRPIPFSGTQKRESARRPGNRMRGIPSSASCRLALPSRLKRRYRVNIPAQRRPNNFAHSVTGCFPSRKSRSNRATGQPAAIPTARPTSWSAPMRATTRSTIGRSTISIGLRSKTPG